ncbi:MAG: MipA/OmpV family protein [Gammaproteobacteria bacterium]|nr:MipA/OmpV family protein [Gammaproteobacteria bacterium]
MSKNNSLYRVISLVSCCLFSSLGYSELDDEEEYIEIGAGLSTFNVPHYAGSDEYETYAVPFPYFVYQTKKVSLNREGLRRHLFYSKTWDIDVSLAGRLPVRDDNKARAGMPELDWVIMAGPSINYKVINDDKQRLKFSLPIHGAIATDFTQATSVGWEFAPGFRWDTLWQVDDTVWRTNFNANIFYSTKKFNRYYYDVPNAFATPERSSYTAESGNSGYQVTFGLTRRKGDIWMGGFVRYRSVADAVFVDSPLVKANDNVYVGFAFAYVLNRESID